MGDGGRILEVALSTVHNNPFMTQSRIHSLSLLLLQNHQGLPLPSDQDRTRLQFKDHDLSPSNLSTQISYALFTK